MFLTTNSLSFFLVRRANRPKHANDYPRDWRRETGEARQKRDSLFSSRAAVLVSRVSQLRRSTLACACTSLTKSEEKERLLKDSLLSSSPLSRLQSREGVICVFRAICSTDQEKRETARSLLHRYTRRSVSDGFLYTLEACLVNFELP